MDLRGHRLHYLPRHALEWVYNVTQTGTLSSFTKCILTNLDRNNIELNIIMQNIILYFIHYIMYSIYNVYVVPFYYVELIIWGYLVLNQFISGINSICS